MWKGVNLGNWLVLEKWMSPELFAGTPAEDETHLCTELDPVAKRERFKTHRDEWITDRDFAYLAARGIDLVRLPVPFHVFGDYEPYVGCVEHVDAAFRWAEQHGIEILLDLHTVPDGQNGFDGGGTTGVCKFHKNPRHVDFTLDVLDRLAERYGGHGSFWGLEVLNEPVSPAMWDLIDVPKRCPAADPERAAGSEPVPTEFLERFYTDAYARIRERAGGVRVVFHDGFRIRELAGFFTRFERIVVDTHMYVMMRTTAAGDRDLDDYVAYIEREFGGTLREMTAQFPVMVGEWNPDTRSPAAGRLTGLQRRDYCGKLIDAYLAALEPATAWCYWSYRLRGDAPENDLWDMGKALELGLLPPGLGAGRRGGDT
jgi:glucan 1,3-beta-glucosidase